MPSTAPQQPPSLYNLLQDEVIAAAEAVGVPLSLNGPFTWETFGETTDYEETPQMVFEDVIQALDLAAKGQQRPGQEWPFVNDAAIAVREAIELLRDVHHLEPLTRLYGVEEVLNRRAQELSTLHTGNAEPG